VGVGKRTRPKNGSSDAEVLTVAGVMAPEAAA
jgi:hypothetical protein